MGLKGVVVVLVVLSAVFGCRQSSHTEIQLNLGAKYGRSEVGIDVGDSTYHVVVDSMGKGRVVLAESCVAGYAGLLYARGWLSLYVEPGKNFEVILQEGVFSFRGEGAAKNDYLNSSFFRDFRYEYDKGEEEFCQFLNGRLCTCYRHLDSLGFDADFVSIERQRLYYDVFLGLAYYPTKHVSDLSDADFHLTGDYADSLLLKMKENEELMGMSEYSYFFRRMIETYCRLINSPVDDLQALDCQLSYVDRCIQGKKLAAFLTDRYMSEYMGNHGVDGLEDVLPFYDRKVTDSVTIQKFKTLYAQWARVAKGQLSPDFCYTDIHGNQVSLADLQGKYVYIDLWATWCYFCCREIPDLKRLEQNLKGRNIYFVSISCDQDTLAWKNKVEQEKLGGIQLICGDDRTFRDIYQVSGIPRFILIDPDGKIVSANMPRPSDPQTEKMLRRLPGI